MAPITTTKNATMIIDVEGQDSAKLLHSVVDYALNNMPALPADDYEVMNALRLDLATLF